MMLMRITEVDYLPRKEPENYSPDDLLVRVVGRSEGGERDMRLIEGTPPYLYVQDSEPVEEHAEDLDVDILDIQSGYEGIDVENSCKVPLKRVTLGHPKQTNALKDECGRTWESDIPFYRRVTWDHNLSGYVRVPEDREKVHIDDVQTDIDAEDVDPIDPRVLIGDIEVVDTEDRGFDEMKESADAPIIAATWYDSYEGDYSVFVVDDGDVDGGDVKEEMASHWDGHELYGEYVEDAEISLYRVEDEAALMGNCIGLIQERRPDITAGWNWVDFDWYYLLKRAKALDDIDPHDFSDVGRVEFRKVNPDRRGVESAVDGLPAFDQMQGLQKQSYSEWRSTALEFVAKAELSIGKIPGMNVAEAYQNDRSRFTAYNILDVQLTVALTDKHGIEDFFLDLADLCGIQIQDTWSEKREVDGYIGSRRDNDEILPIQYERDISSGAGGLVLTPGDGIYEKVAVFDLKSLYPSSMLSMNISPETMTDPEDADIVIPGMPEKEADVDGKITEENIRWQDDESLPWSLRPKGFDFDSQGIVPKYLGGMFPRREEYKAELEQHAEGTTEHTVYDNRQRGIKVVMNSFFGVLLSDYFRLSKDGVGDAITGISRYILWRAADYAENLGYEVIYSDTDSLLISLDRDNDRPSKKVLKDGKGLVNQINDHMSTVAQDLGLPEDHPFVDMDELPHGLGEDANHAWFFEFEKLYDRFIQVGSKKRYAGSLEWTEDDEWDAEKLDVTGFEAARSDQMEITSEVQREVIEMVLDGADFADVSDMLRSKIERFQSDAEDLHEIGIPWNLSKPLAGEGSYGNIPRARAARHSNEHLGKDYVPGDDFRGYYVRRTPSFTPETDVIALDWTEDIPEGYDLDRTRTVEKAFESALTPILEEVGWTFNEILEGKQNQPAAADSVTEFTGDPWSGDSDENEPESSTNNTGGAGAW